jgi:hypothetical protein
LLPAVPAGTQRHTLQHLRHARLHMFLRELALHRTSHAPPQSAYYSQHQTAGTLVSLQMIDL